MAEPNGHPSLPDHTIPNPTTHNHLSLATLGIHADDPINNSTDVAPALHVSTTFRYPSDPSQLNPKDDLHVFDRAPTDPRPADSHVYSRATAPNTSRLELMLSEILGGPVLTYTSGLSAFHALMVHLHPKVIAIGAGYHGCHGVLNIYKKLTNCHIVDLFDESTWQNSTENWSLGKGDVVHLETPVNPTGHAYNISHFADLAHKRGAVLTIDATFAPPPLQDPFQWGADYIMHSGTKYFGGHSDILCGVLAINKGLEGWERRYWDLCGERVFLGAVMGSLEGWLGVRSLRTLELRVTRQSSNCENIVGWLDGCLQSSSEEGEVVRKVVDKIDHASLQKEDMGWLKKQMPNGFGPVFSIWMKSPTYAKRLPSKLRFFHHATSLGGVESLIEWRRMSDQGVEQTLCRISVGIENGEDLRQDLEQAFRRLGEE
jgi:cystathionine beta-lyase/cystathionine gamma-synthase